MNAISPQPSYSDVLARFLVRKPRLLIGGEWVDPQGDEEIPVVDPSNGRQITTLIEASQADVDRAVAAARRAFDDGRWSGLPPARREAVLQRLADLVEANIDELAEIEAVDNGKPCTMARDIAIPAALAQFRYAAGWATKLGGTQVDPALQPTGAFHAYTRREPIGVAALIIPWNFPIVMAALKLAPALAAGCTMVLKPAEQTSLSALRLGELILEAGVPPGVVNIVTGRGATVGDALVRHPDVDKISFTGSTPAGKAIMRAAADSMKRLTLELGGKSPVIMMSDVDRATAAQKAAEAIMFNSGQICVAGSRLYAHRDIYDDLLEGVSKIAGMMRLGPSLAADSELGPLVSDVQQRRVMGYIQSARDEGACVVSGGDTAGDAGYFVQPTIIAQVNARMSVMREEVFGPVLCVSRFDDLDEVVREANASSYGLAASVWTRDINVMHKLASRIKAGTVWGNCHIVVDPALPTGGYKQSGVGREMGLEGVLNFTELKTVAIALAP